jgi:hypothetical protein
MSSSNHGFPKLTPTSNNFFEFVALLKMVLLAKGLWHGVDPSAAVVTKPTVKIEKGATLADNCIPPTDEEQEYLQFNAAALQTHEFVLRIAHSLDFSLHYLFKPYLEPAPNHLGQEVYFDIDSHF